MNTFPAYKSPAQSLYVYKIATLVVLILFIAAAGGLGLLWMRQEISASAARIRNVETRLAEANRRLQYVNVKIAEATTPETLKRRATELGLGLVPPVRDQVVRLEASRRNFATTEGATAIAANTDEPLFVTFELALIKSPTTAN